MDFIKQWTLCVCITLLIAVMLSLISPSGTMGKFYKTVISLFLIASFLMPLSKFDFKDIHWDIDIGVQEESAKDAYETQVETAVKAKLEEGGYASCSVRAKIKLKDNEITVESLEVAVPSKYASEDVKTFILSELGFAADVRYLGD